jgi:hypothetical protein
LLGEENASVTVDGARSDGERQLGERSRKPMSWVNVGDRRRRVLVAANARSGLNRQVLTQAADRRDPPASLRRSFQDGPEDTGVAGGSLGQHPVGGRGDRHSRVTTHEEDQHG